MLEIAISTEIVKEILVGLGYGAFYGAQAALMGYMKSEDLPQSWSVILTKKFWENFDPIKALKTVTIGALLGAFSRGKIYIPLDASSVEMATLTNFVNDIIILGVDQLVKLIVRRTPLVRIWNGFKEKVLKLPLK